jgi:hypothetical protein
MKVYTYSQARQQLSLVLDEASREGVVQIRRRDGRLFVVKPVASGKSPLDVPGVRTTATTKELIEIIREGRSRPYGPVKRRARPGATRKKRTAKR